MSLQFLYGGRDRQAGISAPVETFENEVTWGPYPSIYFTGGVIDGAARDVGNTSYTHVLRAGLLMGVVSATGKLKEWTPTANDGSEHIYGVLLESRSMLSQNVNTDRFTGPLMVAGGALASRLIVPGTTAPGISGNALEWLIRHQISGRFMLDDQFRFNRPANQLHAVTAGERASGITFVANDSHTHYYNTGGTLTLSLGALVPMRGLEFLVTAVVNSTDNVTVSSSTSNIQVPGASDANSLAIAQSTKRIIGTGSKWLVLAY